MTARSPEPLALRDRLRDALAGRAQAGDTASRGLHGPQRSLTHATLLQSQHLTLDDPADAAGRSWLLDLADPLDAAAALLELDGLARRVVLVPPGTPRAQVAALAALAQVDGRIGDAPVPDGPLAGLTPVSLRARPRPLQGSLEPPPAPLHETEWVLLTSGSAGLPKLVRHTLATLTGGIARQGALAGPWVWSTFYDIRRYGGLQILLRAICAAGDLVVSDHREPIDAFLGRVARHGATHVTGTPSHWRLALMSAGLGELAPRYVRMSGEIADQAIIDRLRQAFPAAQVSHAFASTEAGLAFEVDDGRAGFDPALLDRVDGPVQLRVVDDTLRVRSNRTALGYVGDGPGPLRDAEGFVDTGDVIRIEPDRCRFMGRRGGVINVGGRKLHAEEVEAVLLSHPQVRAARVFGRSSPIMGAVVAAEVMPDRWPIEGRQRQDWLSELRRFCASQLPDHMVPATLSLVETLALQASGKVRRDGL